MKPSFYEKNEIENIGFKSIGKNVFISRFARFYGAENMTIGDNVRIDDFCVLSGDISLGSFIHISAFCALYGKKGIEIKDYSGLSPRTTIFSETDDFSGEYLINPMCPEWTTNVTGGKVILEKYVQIGAGSILMPKINIGEGSVVGAMSLVKKDLASWGIYAGVPAKIIKQRQKGLLKYV